MQKDLKERILRQTAKGLAIAALAKRFGVPKGVLTLRIKACDLCGREFLPKVGNQRFCSSLCRKRYELTYRQQRRRFLRLSCDPAKQEQFNRYMARVNKLREKEGRPPYWNIKEGRPYTYEEQQQIKRQSLIQQVLANRQVDVSLFVPAKGSPVGQKALETQCDFGQETFETQSILGGQVILRKCPHPQHRVRRFEHITSEGKKAWLCVCEDCRFCWIEAVSSDKR